MTKSKKRYQEVTKTIELSPSLPEALCRIPDFIDAVKRSELKVNISNIHNQLKKRQKSREKEKKVVLSWFKTQLALIEKSFQYKSLISDKINILKEVINGKVISNLLAKEQMHNVKDAFEELCTSIASFGQEVSKPFESFLKVGKTETTLDSRCRNTDAELLKPNLTIIPNSTNGQKLFKMLGHGFTSARTDSGGGILYIQYGSRQKVDYPTPVYDYLFAPMTVKERALQAKDPVGQLEYLLTLSDYCNYEPMSSQDLITTNTFHEADEQIHKVHRSFFFSMFEAKDPKTHPETVEGLSKKLKLFISQVKLYEGVSGPTAKTFYAQEARDFAYEEGFRFLKSKDVEERSRITINHLKDYLVKRAKQAQLNEKVISFITLSSIRRYVRPMLRQSLEKHGGWRHSK